MGAAAVTEATSKAKRAARQDALRPLVFVALVAVLIGAGAAWVWGEGIWRTIVGPACLGVALILAPAAVHLAFFGSGFSSAYRARRNRNVFDPQDRHHFDANHDEGFDLDRARHLNDDRWLP